MSALYTVTTTYSVGQARKRRHRDGDAIGRTTEYRPLPDMPDVADMAEVPDIGDGGWREQMTGHWNATVSTLRPCISSLRDAGTWRHKGFQSWIPLSIFC